MFIKAVLFRLKPHIFLQKTGAADAYPPHLSADVLLANFNCFDRLPADELAVQELKRQIARLVKRDELLSQCTHTDRAAEDDPVITEIPEQDGSLAALRTWHILGNLYTLAEDGVAAVVPQVIPVPVLHGAKCKCSLIIHEPHAVPAVLRLDGEVQFHHIIVGQSGGGDACFRTLLRVKEARRLVHPIPVRNPLSSMRAKHFAMRPVR